jgi:hypothetical protein
MAEVCAPPTSARDDDDDEPNDSIPNNFADTPGADIGITPKITVPLTPTLTMFPC